MCEHYKRIFVLDRLPHAPPGRPLLLVERVEIGVLALVHHTAHRPRVVDDHVDVVVVEGAKEGEPVGADLKQSSDVGQALAVKLLNVERRGRGLRCG